MGLLKNWRRRRIGRRVFPLKWLSIVVNNVPYYRRLPEQDKAELRRHIMIFLSEKRFEGCGGLKITDEIRLTIAAQACVLLLHRRTDYYPGLLSILVYPNAFLAHREQHLPSGVVVEDSQPLEGQSQRRGPVVLSWEDVQRSIADAGDGHNVVFHEFAHQIDSAAGSGDSSEVLRSRSSFLEWAKVLEKDFRKLQREVSGNRQTLLDSYGATDEAEFFAVATEFFFERPAELQKQHPDLYNELKNFYQQDPAGLVQISA
jgi:Mlc titration factor MtfA (ptsG expression regulator)